MTSNEFSFLNYDVDRCDNQICHKAKECGNAKNMLFYVSENFEKWINTSLIPVLNRDQTELISLSLKIVCRKPE